MMFLKIKNIKLFCGIFILLVSILTITGIANSFVDLGDNLSTNRGVSAGTFQAANSNIQIDVSGLKFSNSSVQSTASWKTTGNSLNFASSQNSTGKTGIGTSLPEEKLHVAGGNIKTSGCATKTKWSVVKQPLGTANMIHDIAFGADGSTALSVPYTGGIIQRSTNAGLTWTDYTAADANIGFSAVFAPNSSTTALSIGALGVIAKTTDGGQTWNKVFSWNRESANHNIAFADSSTAIAMMTTKLFIRSTDGGNTWTETNLGSGGATIRSVAFSSPTVGVGVGHSGTIIRTTDAGQTWSAITHGLTTNILLKTAFADANLGLAVGYSGTILRTQDGGQTWATINHGLSITNPINNVAFVNPTTAVAVIGTGSNGTGMAIRSTDSGQTWSTISLGSTASFNAVAFASGTNVGLIAGRSGGALLRTTDGGVTFTVLDAGENLGFTGISFADENTGVVSGKTFYRTTDAGTTWTEINPSPSMTSSQSVRFISGTNIGLSVGSNGEIFRTTDKGATWSSVLSDSSISLLYSTAFMDANTGIAVGYKSGGGVILRTTDAGQTWNLITHSASSLYFMDAAFVPGTSPGTFVIAAASPAGIIRSTDGGLTWSSVNLSGIGTIGHLRGVSFANSTVGVAVGDSGTIIRSTDSGGTWTRIHYYTDDNMGSGLLKVKLSGDVGISVGYGGRIMRSTDTGATWTSIGWGGPASGGVIANKLAAVDFSSPTTVFAAAARSGIIRSLDAGAIENLVGTCLDLAELYDNSENLEPGMLVSVSADNPNEVRATKAPYEQELLGIVSTKPAVLFEGDSISMGGNNIYQNKIPLALAGRVKSKVSNENGSIQIGDFITSSSKSGIGMKATKPGTIVGKALEPLNSEAGEILVLIKTSYFHGY